jgi:hypothetical protein
MKAPPVVISIGGRLPEAKASLLACLLGRFQPPASTWEKAIREQAAAGLRLDASFENLEEAEAILCWCDQHGLSADLQVPLGVDELEPDPYLLRVRPGLQEARLRTDLDGEPIFSLEELESLLGLLRDRPKEGMQVLEEVVSRLRDLPALTVERSREYDRERDGADVRGGRGRDGSAAGGMLWQA